MNFEKAKALCLTFPGCTESIKWENNLVYSVGEKMFAITDDAIASKGICFKVDDDRFLELTDRPGIIPAPYLARAKWVYIENAKALSDKEAGELLRRSYDLIFAKLTKKLQRELLAAS